MIAQPRAATNDERALSATLHVRYGEMEAVRGVSFQVGAGEAVGLLGANGAGKTTVLKTLMGLVPVASGRVELDGQPLSERAGWERARRGVAWVPEGRRLFPHFTVEENLVAGSYHRRDRAMATRDLKHVYALFPALGERRDQLAKTLSGGEQQMCAIGRAFDAVPVSGAERERILALLAEYRVVPDAG